VGKAADLVKRFRNHLKECRRGRTKKEKWIASLLKRGALPLMEALEVVDESEWESAEMYWISQLNAWGFQLLNGTRGGEGSDGFRGKRHSEQTKAKCAQAAKSKVTKTRLPGVSNGRSRLSEDDVRAIKRSERSCAALSLEFGVSRAHVSLIRSGARWSHVK
jgi:hypothetical protein